MNTTERLQFVGSDKMNFSYGQFLIYDQSELEPGCLWTDRHVAQGFVRRERALGIGTLVEQGIASIRVHSGKPSSLDDYDRVIAVPIDAASGVLCIEGPEEFPVERMVCLKSGQYLVTVAQTKTSEAALNADLFLEPIEPENSISQVLKADGNIGNISQLLETGEAA